MHLLDNPVWSALTSRQEPLAVAHGQARRFPPDVSTLAALADERDELYSDLEKLVKASQMIALLLKAPPQAPVGWEIVRTAPLLQMLYENGTPAGAEHKFIRLGAADAAEMVALAELTKPGPFAMRTHELGTYIGIRDNGKLVAMAGERLRVPGLTEISGVCTHPEHTGKGYAAALIRELLAQIRANGEQPFLHVREANTRAAGLYRHLGFRDRVLLHVAVLKRSG
jgi:ribosomal protein S18 acetylase RimI-like enzyme